jgi:hypothetical protein
LPCHFGGIPEPQRRLLFKSGQALADIDKAIEMRDTAIARAFRLMVAAEDWDAWPFERMLHL